LSISPEVLFPAVNEMVGDAAYSPARFARHAGDVHIDQLMRGHTVETHCAVIREKMGNASREPRTLFKMVLIDRIGLANERTLDLRKISQDFHTDSFQPLHRRNSAKQISLRFSLVVKYIAIMLKQ
jgi:hypothetical protein